jgi:hypothetical protein
MTQGINRGQAGGGVTCFTPLFTPLNNLEVSARFNLEKKKQIAILKARLEMFSLSVLVSRVVMFCVDTPEIKGMYNGRKGTSFLSSLYHLERMINIIGTIHYLLLSSLAINDN